MTTLDPSLGLGVVTDAKMFSTSRIVREISESLAPRVPASEKSRIGLQDRRKADMEITEREESEVPSQLDNDVRQDTPWSATAPAQVIARLKTNFRSGLTSTEAKRRLEEYGTNTLRAAPRKSILEMLWEQFTNVVVLILIFASVASMAFGEYVEGVVILTIVIINAIVSVIQEAKADDALAALKSMSAPIAAVIRDGKVVNVPSAELVPGDVVKLVTGDIVPADIRLFKSSDLTVEEKALTGEAVDVSKKGDLRKKGEPEEKKQEDGKKDVHHNPNMLYASTNVTNGNGSGIVVTTGMNTRIGKIAKLLEGKNDDESQRVLMSESEQVSKLKNEEKDDMEREAKGMFSGLMEGTGTPLQRALHRMGMYMGMGALSICVIVFITGTSLGLSDPSHGDNPVWLQMLMVSVSLAVSGVPEGLPACVTICLAIGMKEMVERHCLVRTLPAVETLGSASIICTDKTGTLTAGEMTAKALWTGDTEYQVQGGGFDVHGAILNPKRQNVDLPQYRDAMVDSLINILVMCSTASLQIDEDREKDKEARVQRHANKKEMRSGVAAGAVPVPQNPEESSSSSSTSTDDEDESSGPAQPPAHSPDDEKRGASERRPSRSALGNDKRLARQWKALGSSTERPLVVLGAKAGYWQEDLAELYPRVLENAYSSSRKMMSTVHSLQTQREAAAAASTVDVLEDKNSAENQKGLEAKAAQDNPFQRAGIVQDASHDYICAVKGAPNIVLKKSTHILRIDGKIEELTEEERELVIKQIDYFSDQAYRVLAGAYRLIDAVPSGDVAEKVKICEEGLVFVGLVASQDPERPEVIDAIATARHAGVKTIMITGDYLNTARAIARNIDLVKTKGMSDAEARAKIAKVSVDSSVLRQHNADGSPMLDKEGNYVYKSRKEIDELTGNVQVFARAQPQDKYEIVVSLQGQGHVCAMTGDGVNDAPALKEAAIGVAMGINGTETAKQASDMVLTNDNFSSIVLAIEQGRVIYANIQKFVTFLLSTNFAEILTIFVAILMGLPSPLEPLQILLINLACDGLPALALSREPAEEGIMREPPRPQKQEIVHSWMWLGIITNSMALFCGILTVYMIGLNWYTDQFEDIFDLQNDNDRHSQGIKVARTMVFINVTFSEYLRSYTVRSPTKSIFSGGLFDNVTLQYCILVSLSLVMCVLYIPGLNDVFSMVSLEGREWGLALAFAVFPVFVTEVVKVYLRQVRSSENKALKKEVKRALFHKKKLPTQAEMPADGGVLDFAAAEARKKQRQQERAERREKEMKRKASKAKSALKHSQLRNESDPTLEQPHI